MKATRIFEILDLAMEARKKGHIFNPLFVGDPGVAKSACCQQWVAKQRKRNPDFGFIDLRIALLESPDVIGFPEIKKDEAGRSRTIHALADFWPTSSEGLLLLEEINRGTTGVMNTLMQVLTDRKVGQDYVMPEGWIIASCINPDSAQFDVNAMDPALRDRFEEFEIDYDHNTFVCYVEENKWSTNIINFIKSGAWIYKGVEQIGKEGKYISPRTWSKLNAAEAAGAGENKDLHDIICRSILGKDIGKEYWTFCHQMAPILAKDLLGSKKKAMDRLKRYANKDSYRGDLIAVTITSLVENYGGQEPGKEQIGEELMVEVAKMIPSDQAVNLIKECLKENMKLLVKNGVKGAVGTEQFKGFVQRHPDLIDILKGNISIERATKDK